MERSSEAKRRIALPTIGHEADASKSQDHHRPSGCLGYGTCETVNPKRRGWSGIGDDKVERINYADYWIERERVQDIEVRNIRANQRCNGMRKIAVENNGAKI